MLYHQDMLRAAPLPPAPLPPCADEPCACARADRDSSGCLTEEEADEYVHLLGQVATWLSHVRRRACCAPARECLAQAAARDLAACVYGSAIGAVM